MHSQGKNSFQSFFPDGFRGIRRRSRIPNPRNADPTKGIPEFSKGNPPGTEPEAAFPAVPGIHDPRKKSGICGSGSFPSGIQPGILRALGSSRNSQDGEFPPAGALKPPGIPEFPRIRREKSRHGAVFHGKTQIPAPGNVGASARIPGNPKLADPGKLFPDIPMGLPGSSLPMEKLGNCSGAGKSWESEGLDPWDRPDPEENSGMRQAGNAGRNSGIRGHGKAAPG